jgi:phosphopantothenate synthetase
MAGEAATGQQSLDFSVKSSAQAIIFHTISVAEIPVVAINSNYSSLVQSESSLTMKW